MNKKIIILSLCLSTLLIIIFIGVNLYPKATLIKITPTSIPQDYSGLEKVILQVPTAFAGDPFDKPRIINLPKGFKISVFAGNLGKARDMAIFDEHSLFVGAIDKVFLLKDMDDNGIAEEKIIVVDKQNNAHGVYFYKNDLYVAETDKVTVYRAIDANGKFSSKEILIKNLPGSAHVTRTIIIGPDQKIYLSIGSSCNICEEKDARVAAIVRYNLDGTNEQIYATGLRNSVGILFNYNQSLEAWQLWSVDNGRDSIGDDIPVEEVNLLEQGKNYGWPYCHGDRIANPEFSTKVDYCKTQTQTPTYSMQAHSAPLGLAFPSKIGSWQDLQNNLFITFHGSWNRTVPTGYKIVRIDTNNSKAASVDFATGWLDENNQVWGRPVDVKFNGLGQMFVSDDQAGAVYLIMPLAELKN